MPASSDSSGLAIAGAGEMLALVRAGRARTRADLIGYTGLARSTVAQRVDALLALGYLRAEESAVSSGGRPPALLDLNPDLGVVLAADFGVTGVHLALCDLGAEVIVDQFHPIDLERGKPEEVLPWLVDRFAELRRETSRASDRLLAVGVGVPAPVDFDAGRPVNAPLMPAWNEFPVAEWLAGELGAPATLDNDVNVMALGEHRLQWPDTDELLFVKVGTGIGCGIISAGRVYRGAVGAAGDLGHIKSEAAGERVCSCGQRGCLEAVAGGRALAARLSEEGVPASGARDVAEALLAGEGRAVALARSAGREIGEILAGVVNFFNPSALVFGGRVAEASDDLLAGVREAVYRRSLPLATRGLEIVRSGGGERSGVVGAAVMAIDHYLEPTSLEARIERDLSRT